MSSAGGEVRSAGLVTAIVCLHPRFLAHFFRKAGDVRSVMHQTVDGLIHYSHTHTHTHS